MYNANLDICRRILELEKQIRQCAVLFWSDMHDDFILCEFDLDFVYLCLIQIIVSSRWNRHIAVFCLQYKYKDALAANA